MKKIKNFLKTQFDALHNDESGAETIEVVLILTAVIALVAIIKLVIIPAIQNRATSTAGCITGGATSC